jgi:hypothetical protein
MAPKAPTAAQAERALRPRAVKARRKAGRVASMTIRGRTLQLHFRDLGPADDVVSRAEAGVPISGVELNIATGKDLMGLDRILVMWWMARRKSGEPNLHYHEVVAEFPTYEDIAEGVFTYETEDDGEGDDPEA